MHIPLHTVRRIHFVGIGGIGMSGIAEVLATMGYAVSGSDLQENANTQRLRTLGVTIYQGHAAAHIETAQVIVVSTAIQKENPEIQAALEQHIPIIPRAEMLAELMRLKLSIAVSGTHGKTTTTSLIAAVLDEAALDPTVVNGGVINAYGTNARLGKGDWIVVEADESDGSFLKLPCTIGVVTNVDAEHMDHYRDFEHVRSCFRQFLEKIPFYGLAVLCCDHPEAAALSQYITGRRVVTYGLNEHAHIRAVNLRTGSEGVTFDVEIAAAGPLVRRVLYAGAESTSLPRTIRDITLPMMGIHNVQNALSAVAIAQELGISDAVIRRALAQFSGVKRRFTKVGEVNGVMIIDDYAHHPVEIHTVLTAARQACAGRVFAVVQPHRYSRLQALFQDFVASFQPADLVIVAPVYAAGESEIAGVDHTALAATIQAQGVTDAMALMQFSDLPNILREHIRPGDMVICLGAGNITQWAAQLPEMLTMHSTILPKSQAAHG